MEREIEGNVTGMGRVIATAEVWEDASGRRGCFIKSAIFAGTRREVPEQMMDLVRQQIGC